MHWVWPLPVLVIATVLGAALGVLGWRSARRRRQALAPWAVPARSGWRPAALAGTWLLLWVALARPQWGTERPAGPLGGNVVVAIDRSASMRATDAQPSRLAVATQWVQDLAAQLPGCRLGLLVFAGEAQALCPTTTDHAIFRDLLTAVPRVFSGQEGSELRPALELGRQVLERAGGGVLVVVTDGEYHDRDPATGLHGERQGMVDLLTVTVGGSTPVPVPGATLGTVVTDPRHGGSALTAAQPEAMRALARASAGLAIDAGSSTAELAAAMRFVEARLASRALPALAVRRAERFRWPLGLALLLLILRLAVPARGRPTVLPPAVQRLGAALVLLLVPGHRVCSEDDGGAAARIAALREVSLQAPGPDRPRCLYNLALALQESGQAEAARRTYAGAMALPGGTAEVRASCLNNLAVLDLAAAGADGDAEAALARLGRAQAGLREALRLDPRLEVARRNLREAEAVAEGARARLAVRGPKPSARAGNAAALPPPKSVAGQVPAPPAAALPAVGGGSALRPGAPLPDGVALERLCRDAGSASEFQQLLRRGRAPVPRTATLPW